MPENLDQLVNGPTRTFVKMVIAAVQLPKSDLAWHCAALSDRAWQSLRLLW